MPERNSFLIIKDCKTMDEAKRWGDRVRPYTDLLKMPLKATECTDGVILEVKTELITEQEYQIIASALGLTSAGMLRVGGGSAPAAPVEPVCPKCKARNLADSRFCTTCGNRLTETQTAA